jgi:hypothetical protein
VTTKWRTRENCVKILLADNFLNVGLSVSLEMERKTKTEANGGTGSKHSSHALIRAQLQVATPTI